MLSELDLSNWCVTDDSIKIFIRFLSTIQPSTRALILNTNLISAKGVVEIIGILSHLHELALYRNHIGDQGARFLSYALCFNQSLTRLNIGDNEIGGEGARALAQMWPANRSLLDLNLAANRIGDDGVAALTRAVAHNRTLLHLNLSHNRIGIRGAAALAHMIRSNPTLKSLGLTGNSFTDPGMLNIVRNLSLSRGLTVCHLDFGHLARLSQCEILIDLLSSDNLQVGVVSLNSTQCDEYMLLTQTRTAIVELTVAVEYLEDWLVIWVTLRQ